MLKQELNFIQNYCIYYKSHICYRIVIIDQPIPPTKMTKNLGLAAQANYSSVNSIHELKPDDGACLFVQR